LKLGFAILPRELFPDRNIDRKIGKDEQEIRLIRANELV
jgi:hypothetical protein